VTTTSNLAQCVGWLSEYLTDHGGTAPSTKVLGAGKEVGYSATMIRVARRRLGIHIYSTRTVPRRTVWTLRPEERPS
jgi:hypothetical protein